MFITVNNAVNNLFFYFSLFLSVEIILPMPTFFANYRLESALCLGSRKHI